MPDKETPTAAEMLAALSKFAENREDIANMPIEEVRAQLAEEGLNLKERHAELRRRLNAIAGQERLQRAAAKRELYHAGRSDTPPVRPPLPPALARKLLMERLGLLQGQNPQVASAYFRRMENATPEDVQQMLDDLDRLDEMPEGNTPR